MPLRPYTSCNPFVLKNLSHHFPDPNTWQQEAASTWGMSLDGFVASLMMLRGTPLAKSTSYLAVGVLSKLNT